MTNYIMMRAPAGMVGSTNSNLRAKKEEGKALATSLAWEGRPDWYHHSRDMTAVEIEDEEDDEE
jgi:hypothetical protein